MLKKIFVSCTTALIAVSVMFGSFTVMAAGTGGKTNVVVYPAPQGPTPADNFDPRLEMMDGTYGVRVRPAGGSDSEWQDVPVYKAKVMSNGARDAGMTYFDCDGPVEVEVTCKGYIDNIENGLNDETAVYPKSYNIDLNYTKGEKVITFTAKPNQKIVLDPNGDTRRNIQIWVGGILNIPSVEELKKQGKTVTVLDAAENPTIAGSYDTDVVYVKRGFYYKPKYYAEETADMCAHVKSNQTWYTEGGAIICGQVSFNNTTNAKYIGRGMIWRPKHAAYYVDDAKNLYIEGVMALNYGWGPYIINVKNGKWEYVGNGGYAINIANSKNIVVKDMRTIAKDTWGDCMDIFVSEDVTVENCFFRGNDDCIAIYGPRWSGQYWGETGNVRNIKVKDCVLMPDLARPIHFGTHGDSSSPNGGRVMDNCRFENIDILTYNKYAFKSDGSRMPQAIRMDVCEGNMITNIYFNDIRIQDFAANKIVEMYMSTQGRYGTSSIPGKGINNVYFKDVVYNNPDPTFDGRITGWNTSDGVDGITQNVTFENLIVNGKLAENAADAHITVGNNTKNIKFVKSGESKYIYNPSIVREDIWPEYYDYARQNGVTASADIASENGSSPAAVLDDDDNTVWYSAVNDTDITFNRGDELGNTLEAKGLIIDLGAQRQINALRLTYADPAKEHSYTVYVSKDGTDWSAGHSDEGNYPGSVFPRQFVDCNRRTKTNWFANQEVPIIGRYVKIIPYRGYSFDLAKVEILGEQKP